MNIFVLHDYFLYVSIVHPSRQNLHPNPHTHATHVQSLIHTKIIYLFLFLGLISGNSAWCKSKRLVNMLLVTNVVKVCWFFKASFLGVYFTNSITHYDVSSHISVSQCFICISLSFFRNWLKYLSFNVAPELNKL